MDEKKSPRRLAAGSMGSDNNSRGNIIAFPLAIATCSCCRSRFQRLRGESWKRLCIDCWKWQKVGQALNQAAVLLRGCDG